MIDRFNAEKLRFLFTGLCITVFLGIGMQAVAGQALSTSGPDSAYCVGAGYLYAVVPGVNNGSPICQFPDNSWCDAHAYFIGNCTPHPSGSISPSGYIATGGVVTPGGLIVPSSTYNPYYVNPYYYNTPNIYNTSQSALDIADETKTCQTMGGRVQSVHTPYGDVNLCVFPDGSSVDLRALYNGVYTGMPPVTYINGVPTSDNWFYYAYSWLNAP